MYVCGYVDVVYEQFLFIQTYQLNSSIETDSNKKLLMGQNPIERKIKRKVEAGVFQHSFIYTFYLHIVTHYKDTNERKKTDGNNNKNTLVCVFLSFVCSLLMYFFVDFSCLSQLHSLVETQQNHNAINVMDNFLFAE